MTKAHATPASEASRARTAALLVLAAVILAGCAAVDRAVQKTTEALEGMGVVTPEQAEAAQRVSTAFRRSADDFTDSEEHYVGRAVAAEIFARYRPLEDEALNGYVTKVGLAVAYASDRPETYRGYRFQVLDSAEANAYAAPGGLIFVTRGMLDLCRDEDMLAGILAHEVAHVAMRHGLKAIQAGRLAEAFKILVAEAGKEASRQYSDEEVDELARVLDGSVSDITNVVLESGYSQANEEEADTLGATYMARAGYEPSALVRFLESIERGGSGAARGGLLATHADAADRREVVAAAIRENGLAGTPPAARTARFRALRG